MSLEPDSELPEPHPARISANPTKKKVINSRNFVFVMIFTINKLELEHKFFEHK